jgi:site-specific DNA-methyltransferase (adenine-specific)
MHPTVKPIQLNKYLALLLLPPSIYAPRRLLVPFAGTASEMIGGLQAGWDEIVGIELEKESAVVARKRIEYWSNDAQA